MSDTQQDQAPEPVRFVSVCDTIQFVDGGGPIIHSTAVGADGSLWERFSTDPAGVWHEIERPVRPPVAVP